MQHFMYSYECPNINTVLLAFKTANTSQALLCCLAGYLRTYSGYVLNDVGDHLCMYVVFCLRCGIQPYEGFGPVS